MLSYAVLYVILFFVPGFLLAQVSGLGGLAWRLFLPFSYILLVINLFVTKLLGLSANMLAVALCVEILGLVVLYALKLRRSRHSFVFSEGMDRGRRWLEEQKDVLIVVLCVFIPISVYLIWAGPYTEVPADFWLHVGKMEREYRALVDNGIFKGFHDWRDFGGKSAAYWYAIQAFLCYSAGISIEQSFAPQSFLNSMVILGGVFAFTARITQGSSLGRVARYIVAGLAVVFFIAHFGTIVFSFVRYYTFAPVIFNYVVYLIFLITLLDFLGRSRYPKWAYLPIFVLLAGLMGVIHVQELMFSCILGYALLCFFWLKQSVFGAANLEGSIHGDRKLGNRELGWIFYSVTTLVVAGALSLHFGLERHNPLAFRRMMDLNNILPFLNNMYVLDPNKQFYQTFTAWGYVVLALFVLNWNWFRNNPVIVCGALSPFFTVLNPVFADLFLRISWPELLWRCLYILPVLPIVAAVIFYRCASFLVRPGHPARAVYAVGTIVLLIAFLFPLKTTFVNAPYSKIYTLEKVPPQDDYREWKDLYQYLNTLKTRRNILTDPVTGYTIRALTPHNYYGAKFYRYSWGGYNRFNFDKYTLKKFRRYNGWLFIINRRDGGYSVTGEIARHWPAVQREVQAYYQDDLLTFVKNHSDVFVKQWESNKITVYSIEFGSGGSSGNSTSPDASAGVAGSAVAGEIEEPGFRYAS